MLSHDLLASLQNETAVVEQFIVALETEAASLLEGGGSEALEASTRTKNELVSQLLKAGANRDALLDQLDYGTGQEGLNAAGQSDPQILAVTDRLLELAEHARQLNATNGSIIETFLTYNQQALDTLRNLAGMGDLYDASGRARTAAAQAKGIRAG